MPSLTELGAGLARSLGIGREHHVRVEGKGRRTVARADTSEKGDFFLESASPSGHVAGGGDAEDLAWLQSLGLRFSGHASFYIENEDGKPETGFVDISNE